MSEIRVVSYLDSRFAIAETYNSFFRDAHEICISSPWVSEPFIFFMKERVPPEAYLNFLIRTPKEYDGTFRAMEALESVRKEMLWQTEVTCVPSLHAKFATANDRDVLFGSSNATTGGMFHNGEVLLVFNGMPAIASRFGEIFEDIRRQRYNRRWSLIKDFHGTHTDMNLVEIAVRFLRNRSDREVSAFSLVSEFQKHSMSFREAKEGLTQMMNHGVLYSPREGYVKLVPKYDL